MKNIIPLHKIDVMRSFVSKICLLLACTVLLAHAIIPHHCHNYKEICLLISSENQCSHHYKHNCNDIPCNCADNHSSHSGLCVVDDFFFPKDNVELDFHLDLDIPDFCCCIPTSINDIVSCDNGNKFQYRQWCFFYDETVVVDMFGMRAPPVC